VTPGGRPAEAPDAEGQVVAGVDGCRAGWVAVIGRVGKLGPGALPFLPESVQARVFPRFDFLLDALPEDAVIAVDMPIGLPERIEGPGRAAEKATRPLLGERQSSVFSIPARPAVEAGAGPFRSELHRREAYRAACAIAERLSHPPRRISIQGFGLFPKIIEIDRLLLADPSRATRVIEGHPELAFRLLNGGTPVPSPKKIQGRVDATGMEDRRRLLLEAGLGRDFLYAPAPAGAAQDDFLDACAMLCVAARHAAGIAVAHPSPPDRDARGLPIAIWA
jgi:predicted RNase H-like nuclease